MSFFLARLLHAKNEVPKFLPAVGFFVVESLKTVKFSKYFQIFQIFVKTNPEIFLPAPGLISKKSSVKVGGVKNILHPPCDGVC